MHELHACTPARAARLAGCQHDIPDGMVRSLVSAPCALGCIMCHAEEQATSEANESACAVCVFRVDFLNVKIHTSTCHAQVWEVEVDDEGCLQLPGVAAPGPVGRTAATATASTMASEPRSNPSTTPPPPPAQPTSPHQQQQQQTTPPVTTNAAAVPPTRGTQGQCITDADLASKLLLVGAKTWGMDVASDGRSLVMSATESGSSSS